MKKQLKLNPIENNKFNLQGLSDEQLNTLLYEHNPTYIVQNYEESKQTNFQSILKTRKTRDLIIKRVIKQSQNHYEALKDNFNFIFNFKTENYRYIEHSFDDVQQRTNKEIEELFLSVVEEINTSIQNIKINLLLLPFVEKKLKKAIPEVQDLANQSFDLIHKLNSVSEHCTKKVNIDLDARNNETQEIVKTMLNFPVKFTHLGIDQFFLTASHAQEYHDEFGLIARQNPYQEIWNRYSDSVNSFEELLSYDLMIQKHRCIFNIYFDLLLTLGMKLGKARILLQGFPTFEKVYSHRIWEINHNYSRKSIYDSKEKNERDRLAAIKEYTDRKDKHETLYQAKFLEWKQTIGLFPSLIRDIMDFLASPEKEKTKGNTKVISWDKKKEYIFIDFSERNQSMIFLVDKGMRIGLPETLTGFLLSNDYIEKLKSQGDFVQNLENMYNSNDSELSKFKHTNFISLDSMHLEMTNFILQKRWFEDLEKPYEFVSEAYA